MTDQLSSSSADRDKNVRKWQFRVAIGAMLLFIPLMYLSRSILHTPKYGLLVVCFAGIYIAASMIINRVSIVTRWRGLGWLVKGLSEGNQAVLTGILVLIGDIAWILFIFTPSLSDKYLNF
jgi:hypothetical protein